jgi:7-cyano-7-deazaguanine synthase
LLLDTKSEFNLVEQRKLLGREMTRAIVLLSGGMDSLVCTAKAVAECDELNFLHFSYGQRTAVREQACFEALVRHYQPKRHRHIDYKWLSEIGGSALTDSSMEIPSHEDSKGIPVTYVPFRNATFLCAAVAWAEVINANCIYIGAVEEDSSGYPDCREVFFDAFKQLITTGSKAANTIEIRTPVLHLNKAEIVQLGMELNAPFVHSWSCYANNDAACGVCDSCRLRLKAFNKAGYEDPITYSKDI